ncbi:Imidazole glycerol phosphate synthase subunit HisH [Propionibacterium freudenreichii]|uniref:imidazole glycerol phosphate synthase subunit HisH n=1 Tax=Propionibacterium freudenreichii TaxID=1744 RepID=UPI0005A5CC24|nr:imidazole glycerol phosphate synthase subunit HisH [Propionibacterium freudenreichii]MDK9330782.1 imidazole glycerol phosphate synthase subunit HisH [Propionibacterium freudenreichii]CEI48759.1 Imidazole glycerol phosphate synthase subunit hisH (IGP synthase glutamine amidotransferase subunit) (IGP synthase subunit hisH) (ImGP synthase subunit hisH) (IGPS subunit hisH) [Propionibacterium freudenreichii]SBN60006.1 Imidazole glycerol phosphate synthase subunit HisH [Propionibacterium freudenrei
MTGPTLAPGALREPGALAASPSVGVLDYGSGNLHSAVRALAAAGARVTLSSSRAELEACERLVVPGVGAFAACMEQLRSVGGVELVRDWAASGRPLLGICVGHQVFFRHGVEKGISSEGIGIYHGTVEMLDAVRLPHMGWNTVEPPADSRLFAGVGDKRFYFVHSYASHAVEQPGAMVTWCEHGGDRFVAGVEWRNVCSTQFHPEKSGAAGARLLANWLAMSPGA